MLLLVVKIKSNFSIKRKGRMMSAAAVCSGAVASAFFKCHKLVRASVTYSQLFWFKISLVLYQFSVLATSNRNLEFTLPWTNKVLFSATRIYVRNSMWWLGLGPWLSGVCRLFTSQCVLAHSLTHCHAVSRCCQSSRLLAPLADGGSELCSNFCQQSKDFWGGCCGTAGQGAACKTNVPYQSARWNPSCSTSYPVHCWFVGKVVEVSLSIPMWETWM